MRFTYSESHSCSNGSLGGSLIMYYNELKLNWPIDYLIQLIENIYETEKVYFIDQATLSIMWNLE